MSKFLVTGGAGFIGSHIVDALMAEGHEVVVLDNFSTGKIDNLKSACPVANSVLLHGGKPENLIVNPTQLVEGDVRDAETCLRAAEGCDGIFHEAALVSVPDSINRPRDNHDINITGTLNVLEAARANDVKRVVFASSAAVYGDNPELPKCEDMLPEPKSPYALAKLAGEHYLKVYADCFGLETVALRYFNVFGPRQDPSSMYSGVISIFSERIQKNLPITVYGDGQQTRDFISVADVVQANLLAMQVDSQRSEVGGQMSEGESDFNGFNEAGGRFNVFNVAVGRQTSLLKLLSTLENLTGKKTALNFSAARPGDIEHSLAELSKVRNFLNYDPKIDFKDGLQELIK